MSTEAPYLRGANGGLLTTEGVIAFVVLSEGSHAERSGPVLVRGPAEADLQLYLVGDNPFENKGLRAYDGERVRVVGSWRNGVLRVDPGSIEGVAVAKVETAPEAVAGMVDASVPLDAVGAAGLVTLGAEGGPAPLPQRLPPEGASLVASSDAPVVAAPDASGAVDPSIRAVDSVEVSPAVLPPTVLAAPTTAPIVPDKGDTATERTTGDDGTGGPA